MEKKTKTPAGNQNKKPQNQTKVHKAGISFELEAWKLLENYAWVEFKGNRSKAEKMRARIRLVSIKFLLF